MISNKQIISEPFGHKINGINRRLEGAIIRSQQTFSKKILAFIFGLLLTLTSSVHAGTLDIDGDGNHDALTDGLLIIRYLFGFSDSALTDGAVSVDATRDAADVLGYLFEIDAELDVDGDGETDALTDGLLVIRYLFGFSDIALTDGAIALSATRNTPVEIASYLDDLLNESLTPEPIVTLFSNPGDSRLLEVELLDGDIIKFIGEKNTKGLATMVSSIQIQPIEGDDTQAFFFDTQSRPIEFLMANGATLKFNWQSNTSVIVSAVSADGASQENILVDLPVENINQITSIRSVQSNLTEGLTRRLVRTSESSKPVFINSVVNVSRCGQPIDNARLVRVTATNFDLGTHEEYFATGVQPGPGQYNVRLPVQFFTPDADLRDTFTNVAGTACAVTDAFIDIASVACKEIKQPFSKILCGVAKRIADKVITEGCDALSENIDEVLDTFIGEGTIFYLPSVVIPGKGELAEGGINASASNPPREFFVEDLPPPPQTAFPPGTYEGQAIWNEPWDKPTRLTVEIDKQGLFKKSHYHGFPPDPYWEGVPHIVTRSPNGDLTEEAYKGAPIVHRADLEQAGSSFSCNWQSVYVIAPSGNHRMTVSLNLIENTDPPKVEVFMRDWAHYYDGTVTKQ